MLNILITGGTGFVGKNLIEALADKGHHFYILTRSPNSHTNTKQTTFINYDHQVEQLPIIHAVINLAGDSLFGYWTKKKKDNILTSRVKTTEKLINLMRNLSKKPEVFISASAVGFYGTSEDNIFSENTPKSGDDFLANVVVEWENTAKQAELLGIRTVYARFGIILGKEGSLPLMSLPVKLFTGGKIGHGEQWMSWVHIKDAVELIIFCLLNNKIKGPVNVTAPHPKRNKDFMKILASELKRPYWFPAPRPLIRLAMGEMSELITKGQYVLPKKAEACNFNFSYPHLKEALHDIFS